MDGKDGQDGGGSAKDARLPAKGAGSGLVKPEYQLQKFFKKGINSMADDKLEEAVRYFERALALDASSVEVMLKLGYARFHMGEHAEALRVYDRVLEIDVANSEAWNLKSLVHYEQGNYARALDCVEKSIDTDPTYGMAWYNKACYLSLLHKIPESIDALKRSIEIDVKNARRSVKDKDFRNVRIEDGFKRIIEVVVLESVRQGYHTIGAIVWTTLLDRKDADEALRNLLGKGLITVHERRDGLHKIPTYDLAEEIAKKVPHKKKGLAGIRRSVGAAPDVDALKRMSRALREMRECIEGEDAGGTLERLEEFVDPKRSGAQMIERFLEEHREMRLWKVRLTEGPPGFIHDNKKKMIQMIENLEMSVTRQLRSSVA